MWRVKHAETQGICLTVMYGKKILYTALCDFIPLLYVGSLCGCFMSWLIPLYAVSVWKRLYARLCAWWTNTQTQKKRKEESWGFVQSGIKRYKQRKRQEESEQDREERRQKEGSIKSKIQWYRDLWQRTLWKIKERGTKRGQRRGVERKRGESGSSCMPENAWQESRDTGLRHLSVGVALYAGLCSGFIVVYAPAFLSFLAISFWKERRNHEDLCQAA